MNAFAALLRAPQYLTHEDAETHEVCGSIYKVMVLKKGQQVVTHAHEYSHAHILGKGKILLEVNGEKIIYEAPAIIEILADVHHGITALEDSIGFCAHDKSLAESVAFRS